MTKLINTLLDKKTSCNPVWFMRQAGRYLPEFKEIRNNNKNFIQLCLNSDLSSKITLQPLKRFNLDAAIIFSDILMVPYALGQKVNFKKDYGPELSNFNNLIFNNVDEENFTKTLSPVYETIAKTRNELHKEKSLISFIGAPWTLAIYMLGLKKNKKELNFIKVKEKEKEINNIINKIHKFLTLHIENQMKAGANVVQIFDSWAGLLPTNKLEKYCYEPNLKLVNFCKSKGYPVICFPKGLKVKYADFCKIVNPNGINLDYDLNPQWAKDNLNNLCIQGGMDPKALLMEDSEMFKEAERYLKIFINYPYIFNLGHGLLPDTKPEKVGKLVNFVQNFN